MTVGKFDRLAVCLLGRKDTVRTIHDPSSLGEAVGGSAGGGFADGTGRPPHKPLSCHWLIVVLLDHRPQISHDDLGGLLDAVDLCLLIVVGFVET